TKKNGASSWGAATALTDLGKAQQSPNICIDTNSNVHVSWHGSGYTGGGATLTKRQVLYRKYSNSSWGQSTP
ncbi:hypothetical protein LCGC14_2626070, partial [marine sediment metagenome]